MTSTNLALTVNYQSKSLATSMIQLKNGASEIIKQKDKEIENLNGKIAELLQVLNNKNYEIDSNIQGKNNQISELEVELDQINSKYELELEVLENAHKMEINNIREQQKREIKSLEAELNHAREQAEFYAESRKKTSAMSKGIYNSDEISNGKASFLSQAAKNLHDKRLASARAEQKELKSKESELSNQLKDLIQKQRSLNSSNSKKLSDKLDRKLRRQSDNIRQSKTNKSPVDLDKIQKKYDDQLQAEKDNEKKEIQSLEKKLKSLTDDLEKIKETQNIPVKGRNQRDTISSISSVNPIKQERKPINAVGFGFVEAEIVRLVNENVSLKNLLDRMDRLAYGKV